MKLVILYLIGLVFGVGISISGMANPAKVLNFFDVFGTFDPSLALVMGAALATTAVGYFFVLRRKAPIFERSFNVPTNRIIDTRLVAGSTVFGIGWGISGFCPGGVLPVLGTGRLEVLMFVTALLAGIFLARAMMRYWARPVAVVAAPSHN